MIHPTNRAEREYLKQKKLEKKSKTKDPAGHVWRRRKVEAAKIAEQDHELEETLSKGSIDGINPG
jgi:hypothetical protein